MCGEMETVDIEIGVRISNESVVAHKKTGYKLQTKALPALSIPEVSALEWENKEHAYNVWTTYLGNGYPVGQYILSIMKINSADYGMAQSFMGEVTAKDQPLVVYGNASEVRNWNLSECLITFQRATFLGLSSDGKTAIYEATLPQNAETTIPAEQEAPEEPEESYIYDEADPGKSIDFAGTLDNVTDETSAVDAVDKALTEVTDEQRQLVTGIDKVTLLAEEAAAKANTVSVDSGVINVTSEDIPATADSALTATTGVLSDAGINMQRNPRAIVNYDAGSSETVSVTTESLPGTVDKVRITTDYAMATVDAQQASSFTMSDRGNQTIEVNFDTDYETVVTVSFPGMSANDTYKAVVDAEGKPVGGKYNPATGTLEAKLTESGVYRVVNNEADFTDIKDKSQEMQDAIKELASKGIINGTTETTYAPDDTISRAEVTALLMRTLSLLNPNANGGFADVTSANWYCGAAGSAKEHNIINGFEDNTFRGDAVIAKDQIVAVSSRTLREQMDYKTPSDVNGELSVYSDAGSIENWAREDVALATMTNLVLKRTDGKFGGSAGMTRGDAAIIIKRLFDKMW